ncbi:MAG: EVE domain-containing protein [Parvularculaceae bacterium]|jgi:predicted RNA-binding protein with PUA-like domain|nr:EVE domain-containing protein [Parvularculaceae bacterium]
MAYWLLKSEPSDWSWAEQVKKGARGAPWTGVRNPQARANMRAMKKGDLGFFYHTGDEKSVVGVVKVVKEAYADPADEAWPLVDVAAVEALARPVTLAAVKAEPKLAQMVLVRNSRLSVQPVTEAEWSSVRKMGGLK